MGLKALGPMIGGLRPAVAAMPKLVDPFYTSGAWRSLISQIKRERGPHCEDCGSGHRVAGDHEVEIKDGGAPLDKRNVRLRCPRCHNRKTAQAKARRARGGG